MSKFEWTFSRCPRDFIAWVIGEFLSEGGEIEAIHITEDGDIKILLSEEMYSRKMKTAFQNAVNSGVKAEGDWDMPYTMSRHFKMSKIDIHPVHSHHRGVPLINWAAGEARLQGIPCKFIASYASKPHKIFFLNEEDLNKFVDILNECQNKWRDGNASLRKGDGKVTWREIVSPEEKLSDMWREEVEELEKMDNLAHKYAKKKKEASSK